MRPRAPSTRRCAWVETTHLPTKASSKSSRSAHYGLSIRLHFHPTKAIPALHCLRPGIRYPTRRGTPLLRPAAGRPEAGAVAPENRGPSGPGPPGHHRRGLAPPSPGPTGTPASAATGSGPGRRLIAVTATARRHGDRHWHTGTVTAGSGPGPLPAPGRCRRITAGGKRPLRLRVGCRASGRRGLDVPVPPPPGHPEQGAQLVQAK
jgi:hypothetical protein